MVDNVIPLELVDLGDGIVIIAGSTLANESMKLDLSRYSHVYISTEQNADLSAPALRDHVRNLVLNGSDEPRSIYDSVDQLAINAMLQINSEPLTKDLNYGPPRLGKRGKRKRW